MYICKTYMYIHIIYVCAVTHVYHFIHTCGSRCMLACTEQTLSRRASAVAAERVLYGIGLINLFALHQFI